MPSNKQKSLRKTPQQETNNKHDVPKDKTHSILYSIVRKKNSSRKIPENSRKIPKMGVRPKRAAHPHLGNFPGIFGIFRIFFPYNTVRRRAVAPSSVVFSTSGQKPFVVSSPKHSLVYGVVAEVGLLKKGRRVVFFWGSETWSE